jgi:hypothetical protein
VLALQPFSNPLAGQDTAEEEGSSNPLFAASQGNPTRQGVKPAGYKK